MSPVRSAVCVWVREREEEREGERERERERERKREISRYCCQLESVSSLLLVLMNICEPCLHFYINICIWISYVAISEKEPLSLTLEKSHQIYGHTRELQYTLVLHSRESIL